MIEEEMLRREKVFLSFAESLIALRLPNLIILFEHLHSDKLRKKNSRGKKE